MKDRFLDYTPLEHRTELNNKLEEKLQSNLADLTSTGITMEQVMVGYQSKLEKEYKILQSRKPIST